MLRLLAATQYGHLSAWFWVAVAGFGVAIVSLMWIVAKKLEQEPVCTHKSYEYDPDCPTCWEEPR